MAYVIGRKADQRFASLIESLGGQRSPAQTPDGVGWHESRRLGQLRDEMAGLCAKTSETS